MTFWIVDFMDSNIIYHPAKFDGLGHSGSGRKMFYLSRDSQDHIIIASCYFLCRNPSK